MGAMALIDLKPIYIERLKEFVREILYKHWDEGYSLDDGDIHEIALKHKLIRKEFAPKEWSDENGLDHWYSLQSWLKKDKT